MFIPLRNFGTYGVVADSQDQALPIGTWSDARNIRFSGLSFEKMLEPTLEAAWDSATNGSPEWFQGWSDGHSTYFALATSSALWFWRSGATGEGSWVQAGSGYSTDGQWQSFEWGDTVIFNNGVNPPQIFNVGTLQFEALPYWGKIAAGPDDIDSGAATKDTVARCTCLLPYKNYLVALGVTESGLYQPNTVWWSGPTDLVGLDESTGGGPPSWDYENPGSLSGKAEVGVGDGALKWGAVLNESLICYTEASATAMTFVGGSFVMSFRRLFNKGVAGLHLAAEFNNQHFCVARDQIYIHDGSTVKLIAKDRVEEEFFVRAGKGGRFGDSSTIDFAAMQLVKNPDRKEIILLFNETYDKWQPVVDCEPYVCDAFRYGLLGLSDFIWPAESSEVGGPTGFQLPELESGDAIPFHSSQSSFVTDNPVVPDACYNSWLKAGGVTGPTGAYRVGGGVYANSLGKTMSMGMVSHITNPDDTGVDRDVFRQTFNIQRDTGVNVGSSSAGVYIGQYLDTEPYLVVEAKPRALSSGYSTKVYFSDLGINPDEAHWYHFEVDYSWSAVPGSYTESIAARLYIDGDMVAEQVTLDSGGSGPYYWYAAELDAQWHSGLSTSAYTNNLYYADSTFSDGGVEWNTLKLAWDRNQSGYEPPAYCANINDGYAYTPTDARGALVWNFEDDNYTWMDAAVDTGTANTGLTDVVCMQYAFNPGFQVRWSDLATSGDKWDGSVGDLLTTTTKWSDFSSHGTEKNLYWLADDGIYRSDQAVKTDGIKDYTVERINIDLDDLNTQWTTNKFKHLRQFYFHLQSPSDAPTTNNFDITLGWSKTLMDDPEWLATSTINLQSTDNSGTYKYDCRTTGRYLSMRMTFNSTYEIKMSGGDMDAEESHGR